jgi:prepilin-type N-terminal cleavage/methylation domain-containing protein
MRNEKRNDGFTLIEVIIVIAVMAILAGAMAPLAVQMIDNSRVDATRKRQELIYRAILGDPSAPGSGFLSDIGALPGANLSQLTTRGALPPYAIDACGVGVGWRGPYVLEGIDSATGEILDGWGIAMDFVNGGSGFQIRSAGRDRAMNTAVDNLLYPSTPITANNVNGSFTLAVSALDTSTAQPTFVPAGGQITIYFAQSGAMQSVVIASPSGSYIYPPAGVGFPQGIHAINITGDPDGAGSQPAIARMITLYCPGGGTAHQSIALR